MTLIMKMTNNPIYSHPYEDDSNDFKYNEISFHDNDNNKVNDDDNVIIIFLIKICIVSMIVDDMR